MQSKFLKPSNNSNLSLSMTSSLPSHDHSFFKPSRTMAEEEEKVITINVKILGSEEEHQLSVPRNLTVHSLKILVHDFCDSPIENIRLIFRGRALQNNETLARYNVESGHTIIVYPSKRTTKTKTNDPAPPPPISQDQPGQTGGEQPQLLPQNPSLPPFPRNEVTKVKKVLSKIQRDAAVLVRDGAQLQAMLAEQSPDPEQINTALKRLVSDNKTMMEQIEPRIQEIRYMEFTTNNNRVEVGNQQTTAQANEPPQTNQPRPGVNDTFTPDELEEIEKVSAGLKDYKKGHSLDTYYKTTNLITLLSYSIGRSPH